MPKPNGFQAVRIVSLMLFTLISIFSIFSTDLYAQDNTRPFDVSLAFRYGILTGDEESGVKWSDLFDNGIGGNLEVGYHINPAFAIHAGLAYESFSGKSIGFFVPGFGSFTGKFNDLNPLSFYGGAKIYLTKLTNPQDAGPVDVYLRMDLGGTYFNKPEFEVAGLGTISLGDSTTEFAWGVGGGVDVRTTPNLNLFVEAKYQDYGKPDQAGESLTAIPLSFGLRFLL